MSILLLFCEKNVAQRERLKRTRATVIRVVTYVVAQHDEIARVIEVPPSILNVMNVEFPVPLMQVAHGTPVMSSAVFLKPWVWH